jgi:hypothetical protein
MYDINGTGGGGKKVKLSEIEDKIIGLISNVVIEGAPLPEAGGSRGDITLMADQNEAVSFLL